MRGALAAVTLVLALAACGGDGGGATTGAAKAKPPVHDLASVSQLRAAFDRASGKPRLVVLVSPT